eukprot:m51a1_g2687 hypothetical protein (347) ;mRNA; r:753099-754309
MEKQPFPSFAALELTYGCNHACTFCSNVWKAPGSTYPVGRELAADEWCSVATRLTALGATNFCITGGEPTLHSGFLDILRHVASLKSFDYSTLSSSPVSVSLLTNGDTEFYDDPENVRAVAGLVATVSVALHGGPERHARLTGGGDHARTVRTMRALSALGCHVNANIVVGGDDARGPEVSAAEAASAALDAGARGLVVMRAMRVGRGAGSQASAFVAGADTEAIRRTVRVVQRIANTRGASVTLACCTPQCVVPEDIENLVVPRVCGCGSATVCVDPAGRVRPCTTSAVIGGSIGEGLYAGSRESDPIVTAVSSQEMGQFVRAAQHGEKPPVCDGCKRIEAEKDV